MAEIARELRPEDFQPWIHPRSDGEPLVSAVLVYAPTAFHRQISMQLARADRGIPDHEAMMRLRAECWRFMQGRLQRGELMAHGHLHGTGQLHAVAPTLFDDAEVDFARNTLTTCGMTFGGIRVFDPSRSLAPPAIAAETPRSRAERWMTENVVAYVPGQRDAKVLECRTALGITKSEALSGWNALPEAIKGKPRTSGR